MKLLRATVVGFTILAFQSYGQNEFPKSLFTKADTGTTNKVTVAVSGYDANAIGNLKDDLIAFDEKVESVHYDEKNYEL